MKERIFYFDTIRFFAAIWVFTTHYIAFVDAGLFRYLHMMPVGLVMGGISGKLCVAVFGVILGYFAFRKGESGRETTLQYAAKRYLYFVLAGLVINLIYGAAAWLGYIDRKISLLQILNSAIWIKWDILDSFWCMRPFLVGSILGFLAGKYQPGFAEAALVTVIFILLNQTWIAITLFGILLALLAKQEKVQRQLEKKWAQALILVFIFVIVNRNESALTYLLDGVFAVGMLLVTAHNRFLRHMLEPKWVRKISKCYMGFYLIHQLSYHTIGAYLLNTYQNVPFKLRFLSVYLICLAINLLLAVPLSHFVNALAGYAGRLIDAAQSKLAAYGR